MLTNKEKISFTRINLFIVLTWLSVYLTLSRIMLPYAIWGFLFEVNMGIMPVLTLSFLIGFFIDKFSPISIERRRNRNMIPTTGQLLNVDIENEYLSATVRYRTKDGQVMEERGRVATDMLNVLQFVPKGIYQVLYDPKRPNKFVIDPQQFDSEPQVYAKQLKNEDKDAIRFYSRFLQRHQIILSEKEIEDIIASGHLDNIGYYTANHWQGGFAGEATVQQPSVPHPPVQQLQFPQPAPAVQRPPAEGQKKQAPSGDGPKKNAQDASRILDI